MNRTQIQEKYAAGDRNFQEFDLSGVDLSGLDLRHADFRGSDLYGAKLMDSLLTNANLSGNTNLAYADLRGSDLSHSNLSGANLEGARLEGTITQGIIYSSTTKFPVGFDPRIAGAISIQEIERQTRIAQTTALKQQPLSAPEPLTASSIPDSSANISTTSAEISPNTKSDPTSHSTESDLSFPSTGFFNTSITTAQPSSLPNVKAIKSNAWIGVSLGAFIVLALGLTFSNLFKPSLDTTSSSNSNPFEQVSYPQPACGDPLPSNPNNFPLNLYPVFINNTSQNLEIVVRQFCQDAFETTRKDSGTPSIQVASFTSRERAEQFAEFMTQKVGSGEVGSSTIIDK
ncbi:MAG TPA: pentapeptide repeat-containing protein [Stenomitos sp.]